MPDLKLQFLVVSIVPANSLKKCGGFCMFSPQVFPLRNIVERGSRISMMAFISQSEFSAV